MTCPKSLPLICDRDIGNQELLPLIRVKKSDSALQRGPKSSLSFCTASYMYSGELGHHTKIDSGVKREKSKREEGKSLKHRETFGAQNP